MKKDNIRTRWTKTAIMNAEYDEKDFAKIAEEHPAGEWQNHNW